MDDYPEEYEDMDDDEADLDVLRELEADREDKENRYKRALFQSQTDLAADAPTKETPINNLKRGISIPLVEIPEDLDKSLDLNAAASAAAANVQQRSPPSKRPRVAPAPISQRISEAPSCILRRIPDGDYQAITVSSGERFYVSLKDSGDLIDDSNVTRRAARSQDQSGLCSAPYSVIMDQALVELDRMREAVARAESRELAAETAAGDSGVESMDDDSSPSLWVEKFRPRSFMQLLSDDGTNRMLLKWLKLWDKVVFGKEKKVRVRKKEEEDNTEKWRKFPKKAQLPDVVEELDEMDRPLQKAALLHGPPGLGKTTLAHVIANHTGYNVVEMNASDDRSLQTFKTKVEASTQMKSVSMKDQRPNCLIIDEIDGAPAPVIAYLVSLISAEAAKKPGKGKKGQALLRPIICICNDLYVPALRPLRQACLLVTFPPTASSRLSQRLMEISRAEYLKTDTSALLALCEKTDNDIRSCLSTLQFFKSRGKELKVSDVARATLGQKDAQKSHFAVWNEIFEVPRASKKQWTDVGRKPGEDCASENATSIPARFRSVFSTVTACGDYERLMLGVFENYLEVKFKDSMLESVGIGCDWFCVFDVTQQQIAHSQSYSLMGYLPFALVASHLLFAAHSKSKLSYPLVHGEKMTQQSRAVNLMATLVSEMSPTNRSFTNNTTLVFDLLPSLLEIMQPNIRAVNTQLYSPREKEELKGVVTIMTAYNLTYKQDRTPDGQYVYKLDPNMDDVAHFPDMKHRTLPYSIKQLIAHEIAIERMRLENPASVAAVGQTAEAPKNYAAGQQHAPEQQQQQDASETKPVPRALQKLQSKQIDVKEKSPVDFFGRRIEKKAEMSASSKEKQEQSGIVVSDIWFRFKEGYNNAVRRNVKLKELL